MHVVVVSNVISSFFSCAVEMTFLFLPDHGLAWCDITIVRLLCDNQAISSLKKVSALGVPLLRTSRPVAVFGRKHNQRAFSWYCMEKKLVFLPPLY